MPSIANTQRNISMHTNCHSLTQDSQLIKCYFNAIHNIYELTIYAWNNFLDNPNLLLSSSMKIIDIAVPHIAQILHGDVWVRRHVICSQMQITVAFNTGQDVGEGCLAAIRFLPIIIDVGRTVLHILSGTNRVEFAHFLSGYFNATSVVLPLLQRQLVYVDNMGKYCISICRSWSFFHIETGHK